MPTAQLRPVADRSFVQQIVIVNRRESRNSIVFSNISRQTCRGRDSTVLGNLTMNAVSYGW